MNIKIGEKYLITSDPLNIIVNERYKKQDESFDYKSIQWQGSLETACIRILDHEIKKSDAKTVKDLMDHVTQAKKEIVKALNDNSKKIIQEEENKRKPLNAVINKLKKLCIERNKQAAEILPYELLEIINGDGGHHE